MIFWRPPPTALSLWGHGDPPRALSCGAMGTPETDPYRKPRVPVPMGPQGLPETPVLIPMGSCGPPEPPFHRDPPNLIPAGPRGPRSQPCCSSRACVSLSPCSGGQQPYQAQGTLCPHPDRPGVPVGFPPCRDPHPVPIPRAGGSIPALPTCSSREAPPGGTRGHAGTVPLPCRVCKHGHTDLRPLTHTWAPHGLGGCGMGPQNPPAPLLPPSPHSLFLLPLNPIEF